MGRYHVLPCIVAASIFFVKAVETVNGNAISQGRTTQTRAGWSYSNVNEWHTAYPAYCAGNMQSPINFNRFQAKFGIFYPQISFEDYEETPTSVTVTNNGHTAVMAYTMPAGASPRMKGAWLKDNYIFAQCHFHWGSDATKGSEHTMDTTRFPMEMHLVHYKASYGSLGNAVPNSDGLAVLGIFFKLSREDNPALAPFITSLSAITYTGNSTTGSNFYALASLLPKNTRQFFRYQGSLTTPNCNEVVTWTVFSEALGVSNAQLTQLRSLMDYQGNYIQDNFRPPQQVNNRTVYKSFF